MRPLTVLPAAVLLLTLASPVLAEPAVVRFTDETGTRRIARVSDVALLEPSCTQPAVLPDEARPLGMEVGSGEWSPIAMRAGETVLLRDADGPGWCAADPALVRALDAAQPAPQSRGPWLAFVLAFGGLAAGVLLIVLWGAGRGPEPTLGPAAPDPHEQPAEPHEEEAQDAVPGAIGHSAE